jgi:hypothetical protein
MEEYVYCLKQEAEEIFLGLPFDTEDGGSMFCRNVKLVRTTRRHIPVLFLVTVVRTLTSTAYLGDFCKDLVTGSYGVISDTMDLHFKFRGKAQKKKTIAPITFKPVFLRKGAGGSTHKTI